MFFLAAQACVLVGFSSTLYVVADSYLYRQVDEHLAAALDTLVAAAEVKPDGVEWEENQRLLSLGQEPGPESIRWLVDGRVCADDDRGQQVARSSNIGDSKLFGSVHRSFSADAPHQEAEIEGQPWRFVQRRVQAPTSRRVVVSEPGEKKYHALLIMVGVSLQPLQATLRNLLLGLSGVSAVLWLVAAIAGRWVCRRALIPVRRMAQTARAMKAAELNERLPVPNTADEVADLGQAFNELLSRRDEAYERQRRFTGDASHQLRTPLTAMFGQIEVALRRERSADEYGKTLRLVQGQAARLRQIIDALLYLARADNEARLPNLETIDLTRWLEQHLQTWSNHPRKDDFRLKVDGEGLFLVQAQSPLLGQLVDNLLDNACKYSEPGTPITIHLGKEDGKISLSIDDTGCGVSNEELAYIFEPFYRSPDARRRGLAGVGLGLAIAQRIAIAFGGALTVESSNRQGACFTLRLPEK
jgi:heavy metal sensor kinase